MLRLRVIYKSGMKQKHELSDLCLTSFVYGLIMTFMRDFLCVGPSGPGPGSEGWSGMAPGRGTSSKQPSVALYRCRLSVGRTGVGKVGVPGQNGMYMSHAL